MRKLIAFVLFSLLSVAALIGPASPVPAAQCGSECDGYRGACREFSDIYYETCRAGGGSIVWCWIDSQDVYQLCVSNSSGGACSIFH